MAELKDILPPPAQALELPPEELSVLILKHLSQLPSDGSGQLNRYNFTLSSNVIPYSGRELGDKVARAFMEAWIWLEREGFLAPKPGDTGNWVFITRKGKKLADEIDSASLRTYLLGDLLPAQNLASALVRYVRPLFLRGDYDTAVFRAFKEVEVKVRKAAMLAPEDIGVNLMRKAFHPETGPLADKAAPVAERDADTALFAGAIGKFKNPSSHRDVDFDQPTSAAKAILLADLLLGIIEERIKKPAKPVLSNLPNSPSPS